MTDRKLASIRRIDEILPIPDADAIEVAVVGGWKVVVKRGEFALGDLAVYFEIDSWVPHALAPFLSKGQPPREYNGVAGERLRTIKLRGQVSQGLLLSRDVALPMTNSFQEDDDVTEFLNVQKYEKPMNAQLAGMARGNFPTLLRKTDQERIQNLKREFNSFREFTWEITEKLDGSSMTVYRIAGQFGVCSRNLDLTETEGNAFWAMARKLNIEEQLVDAGIDDIAIQGELIGPGIQGNPYKLSAPEFYVFDIYSVELQGYVNADCRREMVDLMELRHTPILMKNGIVGPDDTIDSILLSAEGKSVLNIQTEREGLVFKCIEKPDLSFKAISNKFLLKNGD